MPKLRLYYFFKQRLDQFAAEYASVLANDGIYQNNWQESNQTMKWSTVSKQTCFCLIDIQCKDVKCISNTNLEVCAI